MSGIYFKKAIINNPYNLLPIGVVYSIPNSNYKVLSTEAISLYIYLSRKFYKEFNQSQFNLKFSDLYNCLFMNKTQYKKRKDILYNAINELKDNDLLQCKYNMRDETIKNISIAYIDKNIPKVKLSNTDYNTLLEINKPKLFRLYSILACRMSKDKFTYPTTSQLIDQFNIKVSKNTVVSLLDKLIELNIIYKNTISIDKCLRKSIYGLHKDRTKVNKQAKKMLYNKGTNKQD